VSARLHRAWAMAGALLLIAKEIRGVAVVVTAVSLWFRSK